MDFCKKLTEEEKRLRLVRKEWQIKRKLEQIHEERKLEMIKEYERRRAKKLKLNQQDSQQSKSCSREEQHRRTVSIDYKHSKELGTSSVHNCQKNIIIDEKELRKIKINIYKEKRIQETSKNKIEQDINLDEIILPRRKGEGSHPIFERKEIKTGKIKEEQTVTFIQDNQSEKQLSTSEKSVDQNTSNQYYSDSRSYGPYRDDGTNNDRHKRDRSRSSKVEKDNKEKYWDRNRRDRGSDRSDMSSESRSNLSYSVSNTIGMHFPTTVPFNIQMPSAMWPVAPGLFTPFPLRVPLNMNMWRPPLPRFANYNVNRRANYNPHN